MISKCCWSEDTSERDKQLFFILSNLYQTHPALLHRLLNPDFPVLINPHLSVEERCFGLSSGEKLLMRVGLDIWNSSGGIHFDELYRTLDPFSFQKMLTALLYLRSPGQAVLF